MQVYYTDDEVTRLFRTEYKREWDSVNMHGVRPSPNDIRKMLGIPTKRKFFWFF